MAQTLNHVSTRMQALEAQNATTTQVVEDRTGAVTRQLQEAFAALDGRLKQLDTRTTLVAADTAEIVVARLDAAEQRREEARAAAAAQARLDAAAEQQRAADAVVAAATTTIAARLDERFEALKAQLVAVGSAAAVADARRVLVREAACQAGNGWAGGGGLVPGHEDDNFVRGQHVAPLGGELGRGDDDDDDIFSW
ncbi:hypothetical protein HK405_015712 [Cladochytrium tenue]|nr:hypothetical protein HK405_015712 [Cladochytrium tenue]